MESLVDKMYIIKLITTAVIDISSQSISRVVLLLLLPPVLTPDSRTVV